MYWAKRNDPTADSLGLKDKVQGKGLSTRNPSVIHSRTALEALRTINPKAQLTLSH